MAAFDRLERLGEKKFTFIINALMRGEPAMGLAKKVQQEWGDFQDVQEKTLTQQLNRLKIAVSNGMFGPRIAKEIENGKGIQDVKLTSTTATLPVLNRMEELADWQRQRVMDVREKEAKMPVLAGSLLHAANAVFNDYSKMLQDIQKMRFELGLEQYHPMLQGFKGSSTTTVMPDGTKIQTQVIEAVNAIEEVLNRRRIPPPVIDMQ